MRVACFPVSYERIVKNVIPRWPVRSTAKACLPPSVFPVADAEDALFLKQRSQQRRIGATVEVEGLRQNIFPAPAQVNAASMGSPQTRTRPQTGSARLMTGNGAGAPVLPSG